jgi:hypothetical protein
MLICNTIVESLFNGKPKTPGGTEKAAVEVCYNAFSPAVSAMRSTAGIYRLTEKSIPIY